MRDRLTDPVQQLVGVLRDMVRGGAALPAERTLADQLGVTRHKLRQALETLRTAGDIREPQRSVARRRSKSNGGWRGEAIVHGTSVLEVIELRLILEPALARLAAVRATPAGILRIQRAATTHVGMESGAVDLAFHNAIAAGASNGLAADLMVLLRRIGSDVRVRLGSSQPACPNRIHQRDAEHRAIADAIAARNPEDAERAMRAHLAMVHRQIQRRLSPDLAGEAA